MELRPPDNALPENNSSILQKAEEPPVKERSLGRTLYSIALYVAVDYWIFKSWWAVAVLVSMILIHELGHFIAMKAFGYKGVSMTFVPFMGAYVSGETANPSQLKRTIMLLAGPLPGIVIGVVCFLLYYNGGNHLLYFPAFTFILLNAANLLPFTPLDGGQLLENLFLNASARLQSIFIIISAIGIAAISIYLESYIFLIILLPLWMRFNQISQAGKVRQVLTERGIDFNKSYDALTDDEYWLIRNAVIANNKALQRFDPDEPHKDEATLIPFVKLVLAPNVALDMSGWQKLLTVVVWVVFLLGSVGLWINAGIYRV